MEKSIEVLKYIQDNVFSLENQLDIYNIKNFTSWEDFLKIVDNLENKNLIEENGKRDSYLITDYGKKYLRQKIEDFEKQQELEHLELDKLKTDLILSKWLLKTKWLPHIVATASFLFSVYVYIDAKYDSTKFEKRIENLELKLKVQKNASKK